MRQYGSHEASSRQCNCHSGASWRRRAAGAAALLVLAGCGGPGGDRAASPGGRGLDAVLLVTIDTLPADRVGSWGSPIVRTPFLDRLAREGLQVRDAIAPAPLTAPSHVTMLTGLEPPEHGVRENGLFRLPDSVTTVPETLPDGTRAAAFVAALPLVRSLNLDQGFDLYDDFLGPPRGPRIAPRRDAPQVLEAASAWLRSVPAGARPFAWIHLFDPHHPWDPPDPWIAAAATLPGAGAYEGEVAFTDRELGRFLRGIGADGRDRRATLVVLADHGEALGAHGEETHSLFVYDATQRVPWILAGPGVAAGIEARPRPLLDVAPTLRAAYGLEPLDAHEGAPLGQPPTGTIAYLETRHTDLLLGWAPLYGARDARWKYVRAPRPELYDLAADPAESHNLHDRHPDEVARLESFVAAVLARGVPEGETPSTMDPEVAARLRSLGYLGSPEEAAVRTGAADPKDKVAGAAALFRGQNAWDAGDWKLAERELLAAAAADPERKEPWSFLAGTYLQLGRWDRAIECAERFLSMEPHVNEAPVHGDLGQALVMADRPAEAIPHLETALAAMPDNDYLRGVLARARREAAGANGGR